MKKNIIITILSILLLISISIIIINHNSYEKDLSNLQEEIKNLDKTSSAYKETLENMMINDTKEEEETPTDEYSNIISIDYNSYQKLLNQNQSFILVATQAYCSHCHEYKPILNKVLKKLGLLAYEVELQSLKEEDREKFLEETGVTGTPTTLFYNRGITDYENSFVGKISEDELTNKLKNIKYLS